MIETYDFLTEEESNIISDYILKTEFEVKSMGEDVYPLTSKNSLTGRFAVHNYLNFYPGKILIPKLKNIFGNSVIQCWANTFRKNEGIKKHSHGVGFLSANVFLFGDPNIGTTYDGKKIINEIGKLNVFPSETIHWVDPNPSEKIRISMAFDIYPVTCLSDEKYKNMSRFYTIK